VPRTSRTQYRQRRPEETVLYRLVQAHLEAAIAYLQQKIAEDPRPVPKPPTYPKRVFKYPPS
jgi:hypothetical protein